MAAKKSSAAGAAKKSPRKSARKSAKKTAAKSAAPTAEKTEKVDLKRSITRGGRTYGPGKGIPVPASLAESVRHANAAKGE